MVANLLSVKGRLRIIGELWARKKPEGIDETLADFATRRLGREAYEKLLDPMVSGIFAGNPENMSLESCFPRIAELERNYGGLIKAMIKIGREKKKEDKKTGAKKPKAGPAGPGGILTSFRDGIEELILSLEQNINGSILKNSEIINISKTNSHYELTTESGILDADILVFAVPAYNGAEIFKTYDREISGVLKTIPYSPLAVVAFGLQKSSVDNPLNGFGFLIPSRENRRILGSLWTSSIFPIREAPFL